MHLDIEPLQSKEPDLAWSLDEDGLKFTNGDSSHSREIESKKAVKKNAQSSNSRDDDDDSGPSGISIVAKWVGVGMGMAMAMPLFAFPGNPARA
jgi:hypothetical protein